MKFSVTPQALRAAVEELGPSAEGVRKKLHAAARESFEKGGEAKRGMRRSAEASADNG